MSDRPPSLQDVLKRRQTSSFVGRAGELWQFEENLRLGADDVRRKFLFSLHGTAGVGKTTLLKQLLRLATDQDYLTGFVDEVAYDIPSTLQTLADDFETQSVRIRRLRKRLSTYQQRRVELDADPGAPSPVTRTAVGLAIGVAKELPIARTVAGALDAGTAASEVDRYQKYLRRRFRDPDDVQLLLSPEKMLTQAFLADLREIAETQSIALFFDTYEYTGTFLEPWLLGLLAGRFGPAPPNIVLTIAGQQPLALNKWSDYLLARRDLPLSEFTDDEARKLLAVRGVTNDEVVDAILRRSGSLPLLVASYSEGRPAKVDDLGDPTNDVIERFLKWEPDPKRRTAALLGALPRTLNQEIFAVVADSPSIGEDYARLRTLSFVKEHADGLSYHDLARQAMLRQVRGTTPAEWQQRHRALADHYRQAREELGLEGTIAWRNERWQRLAMEEQYHLLCSGSKDAIRSALGGLAKVITWRRGMVARWARTIHQAGLDRADAGLAQRGDRLATWADSNSTDDRLRLVTELADDPSLEPTTRALAYTERADIRAERTEFDTALSDANRAIELWPNMHRIIAQRGEVHRLMGRLNEAQTDFSRAIEIMPDYKWARAGRVETYQAMNRTDDALAELARLLEIDSASAWASVKRGTILNRRGRRKEALADLDRAVEIEPDSTWALTIRAQIYRAMKRTDDALADLTRAIEIDPNYVWASFVRGSVYRRLGRHEEALADFNRAFNIDSDNTWALFERSKIYAALDQIDLALADLNRAIAIDPNYAEAFAERGNLYHELNRHQDALAEYDRALEIKPDTDWILADRSQVCLALGDFDGALADLNRAIEIDPDYSWAIVERGDLLHDMERFEDALDDFSHALEIKPDDPWPLFYRANTYVAVERNDEALADLTRATELDPKYMWARVRRARVLHRLGRTDEALAELEYALEVNPKYDSAFDARGSLNRLTGHHELAIADLERSLELAPDSGWAHYQIALSLVALGRTAEASARLVRAVEVERANTHATATHAYRRFNVAVYLLALERSGEAEVQIRETLGRPVLPGDIRTAIEDLNDLHEATGQDVQTCVEMLRAALG